MIVLVRIQPPQGIDGSVMILSSLKVSTDTKGEWVAHTLSRDVYFKWSYNIKLSFHLEYISSAYVFD